MRVGMTKMMAKRANMLGGIHRHNMFKFPSKKHLNFHRVAELVCMSLMKNPEKIQVLKVLNVLFIDELEQISAVLLLMLDIILRKIRKNNIFFGGFYDYSFIGS
jgi:hypothetical protein